MLLRGDTMGYRIAYKTIQKKPRGKRFSIRLPALIVLCFSLFIFLVEMLWPDGAALLKKTLALPGEAIGVSALNDLAAELQGGASVVTAFADFCGKLLP